ncbi:hypothetical protein ASPZODRAFT_131040 [Penicilliopsis zonata CBS 506.65]|uniref:Ribosomal RNA-processing protein 14/surfeit locus protein 6 C-terminal domain-containing protein n=1 Tax=Penicilliopsis zonata CBS 506.65 TaxID=1073090 RepID=A0A1L9SKA4_9EURO|nr:hypothetical protein ASPZODRAFT_131040 [Penicilliopsis zonata CBS 506.65]OJJ47526.1 hypothetical protein ASPZODRAFT_131040 [Penicilliopsis zonata CBS 506.65]
MADLEERLRSHAQAFDGLLSLIPAKYYYGDDTSDQWQRKKQTKEQAREAKRAKLDPESAKTAKDVLEENARKRKRNEDAAGSDSSDSELGSELPKEGLNRGNAKGKKQKQAEPVNKSDNAAAKLEEAQARKKVKEEKKAQKKAAQKEKKKAKESARKEKQQSEPKKADLAQESKKPTKQTDDGHKEDSASEAEDDEEEEEDEEDGVVEEGFSVEFEAEQPEIPSSVSSAPQSPDSDAPNPDSGSSSISSILPPTDTSKTSTSEPKPLKATPEQLKQRLQKRLDELRAARHADGLNGKPARNRHELIEARRQKAEQRKAHKKLLRQKAKEEEQRLKDEAMARRFSPGGSGSLLASPRSPAESVGSSANNYSFGRVVFADGQQADASLSSLREHKRQNAQDPATALKAAESKQARLAAMDEGKRADIEEKDMWLNAKKRAHGERVRDDTSLLKKALKRKETAKKKSEREWRERIDGVAKGKEARQMKREENLRKRRDEKGAGGGKGKGKKPAGKRKARPGFEGSFKAKVGGKKK